MRIVGKRRNIHVFLACLLVTGAVFLFFTAFLESPSALPEDPLATTPAWTRDALIPLHPAALPEANDKTRLGERLFFDKRLSGNNTIACASCHDPERGGTDRLAVSSGVDNRQGSINSPTVFNASLHFAQFWDGRADTLEAQAVGPIHNPVEMASGWPEIIDRLSADPAYRSAFAGLYPEGISATAILDAIASYERTLLTPNSRFDRFLDGDERILTPLELTGYRCFLDYGCASCHQGVALGGNMYQRFGVMQDYFAGRPVSPSDLGRYNITGKEEDRHVFKVPSLRNIAVTAPYFHDASAGTLEEAVAVMGSYQLGRELGSEDIRSLSAFLRTMTGEWRGKRLQ
ncbi:cytochrome-c peroxidase [Laribacter hongkongensis]|uniref:cytochrome-c peroxidase n=1 Tax=Laribacter hongkongensis TaxID=168471 RepID=UPI001EFC8B90|nr:cytochrome-c peroxidase [Laribacter hongkongensis]MCG8996456.1 cytochrome-c peroxidase [Laribacter hongkongensis]MCG9011596.1 cytochrome-c peroxidase [Laribacter hongkongensis]MCG9023343.1 cytochrome-c peroxidase [Laribacter hongkongensis]MCG9046913.1 cytochrome-c peroxidase [Laribacter hongkongensis]MCG9074258.1 cytochrome-c peroxidase [Laribacter hongkongensis]